MKKLMVILLTGWAFVLSYHVQNVAANEEGHGGIPLCNLAGTYADTIHAAIFVCLESTPPHGQTTCTEGASGVSIDALAVGTYTSDANGNACVTWTETETFLPVSATPPTVLVVHQAAKITSYDATTGAGEGSYTNYFGGTCHGSTFDSTEARAVSTGTYHFVASKKGKRMDAVVTAFTNSVGAFGDFSISATLLRQ